MSHLVRLAAGLLPLVAACSEPEADPDAVSERLLAVLPGVVDPAADSLSVAGDSTALASLSDSLTAVDGALGLPFTLSPTSDGDTVPTIALAEGDSEEGIDGDEVAQRLIDTIFTAENYEGDGVYRVRGADFCPVDETDTPDPECVDQIDRAELRIKVEIAGDGLDFTLLVGPDRAAPIIVELRSNRITVVVDLDESAEAAAWIGSVTGEEIELPEVMTGQTAFSLLVDGPQQVSIEIAVREAVRIEAEIEGGRFVYATEARDPLASISIDAALRELTALFDLGPTELSMPWQRLDAESLATGTFTLDWKGLSFTATARDGDDVLRIDNIGFGDSTSRVKLDDHTLVAVDLNPSAGRRFALSVRPASTGLPLVTFAPELDLSLAFDMRPLVEAGDVIDSWLVHETYRITFDGDEPTWQAIAEDAVAGTPGALRIASGELNLASSAADAPVAVSAGQCLLADPVDAGEHPVLGAVAAGDCP